MVHHNVPRLAFSNSISTGHLLLQNGPKTKSTAPSIPTSQIRTQSQDRTRAKEQEKKKTKKSSGDASAKSSKVKNETSKRNE